MSSRPGDCNTSAVVENPQSLRAPVTECLKTLIEVSHRNNGSDTEIFVDPMAVFHPAQGEPGEDHYVPAHLSMCSSLTAKTEHYLKVTYDVAGVDREVRPTKSLVDKIIKAVLSPEPLEEPSVIL